MQEDNLLKQEQSVQKQEAMRRRTYCTGWGGGNQKFKVFRLRVWLRHQFSTGRMFLLERYTHFCNPTFQRYLGKPHYTVVECRFGQSPTCKTAVSHLLLCLFVCLETIEHEAELRHRNEMLRVEAEIKGK